MKGVGQVVKGQLVVKPVVGEVVTTRTVTAMHKIALKPPRVKLLNLDRLVVLLQMLMGHQLTALGSRL